MGKTRGFTLIELMVTIAVLAVIAMMAAPVLTKIIYKSQLNNDARDFQDKLIEKRSNALLRQKAQTLTIDINKVDAWQPKAEVEWDSTLSSSDKEITYNMMGLLDSASNLCFVLQHKDNNDLKAVIILRKTGLIIYEKNKNNCSNLGID